MSTGIEGRIQAKAVPLNADTHPLPTSSEEAERFTRTVEVEGKARQPNAPLPHPFHAGRGNSKKERQTLVRSGPVLPIHAVYYRERQWGGRTIREPDQVVFWIPREQLPFYLLRYTARFVPMDARLLTAASQTKYPKAVRFFRTLDTFIAIGRTKENCSWPLWQIMAGSPLLREYFTVAGRVDTTAKEGRVGPCGPPATRDKLLQAAGLRRDGPLRWRRRKSRRRYLARLFQEIHDVFQDKVARGLISTARITTSEGRAFVLASGTSWKDVDFLEWLHPGNGRRGPRLDPDEVLAYQLSVELGDRHRLALSGRADRTPRTS